MGALAEEEGHHPAILNGMGPRDGDALDPQDSRVAPQRLHHGGEGRFARDHSDFLLRSDENRECDEDQNRIVEKSKDGEQDGETLADPGGDLRGPCVGHDHRQKRSEYSASIHRERRDQIKRDQKHIGPGNFVQQFDPWVFQLLDLLKPVVT